MVKVRDLGERKVIEKIIDGLNKDPDMRLPFGDDVSAVSLNHDSLAILKTDMLVEETDIPPGMTLRQAARKAVVMNISDFAAKGVKPRALLVSLGLPSDTTEKDVEELSKGLNDGVREYDTYLIGGDTGEAPCLIICCMVFGVSLNETLITRSGAKPGDILAVTGPFGKSAAGLKMLIERFEIEGHNSLLEAVYFPKALLNEGCTLAKTGIVSSSIDSSDGLAVSLHELRKMSHVGFTLTEVPIAEEVVKFANRYKLDALELALYGGEEYELVVTVKQGCLDKAQKALYGVGGKLIVIGKATKDQRIILRKNGFEKNILYRGWEHFQCRH